MANLLCKVHPDAKKSSAYVVVTEPTGSEGHPLPAVGGDPVVQACALMALQQAAHLAGVAAGRASGTIDTRPKPQQFEAKSSISNARCAQPFCVALLERGTRAR